jgi:hypothetical protein
MLCSYLQSQGFYVTRQRIIDSFLRVNGAPAEFGRQRIERRPYSVPGPNSLWHHDGNHSTHIELQLGVPSDKLPMNSSDPLEDHHPRIS